MKTISTHKNYNFGIDLATGKDYSRLIMGKVSPKGIEFRVIPNWLGKLLCFIYKLSLKELKK